MPIRIKRHDKNATLTQVLDSSAVRHKPSPRSCASYTALPGLFAVLGGPA